ncbi:DUF6406 domain-containing protein [Actinopolymorpha alba]|uniref:DUF6406 domain-containing protein n=1 Tax=Actinopolymorpha alba TaxID=533267 RepID=UPI00036916DD|nr:DUF6406 domain-containing protein [Actinopolymorpha alba]
MTQPPLGTKLKLSRGTIDHSRLASLAVLRLLPAEQGIKSRGAELLVVVDKEEQEVQVNVGETFQVRDQVWRLDSVVNEAEFAATISRIY